MKLSSMWNRLQKSIAANYHLIPVLLLLVFVGIVAVQGNHRLTVSPEVAFTDAAPSGLSIVPASCPSDPHFAGDCSPACPAGQVMLNGSCVPGTTGGSCPSGYILGLNNICFITGTTLSCPDGYTLVPQGAGSMCVGAPVCPSGYTLSTGNVCLVNLPPDGICPPGEYAANDECWFAYCLLPTQYISDESTGTCSDCPEGYTAIENRCTPPFAPSIVTWLVKPTLVRTGTKVSLSWEADNVTSCSITGTNGDSWGGDCADGVCKDAEQSAPIVAETIYTIVCNGAVGATPSTVTNNATVEIVPTFEER